MKTIILSSIACVFLFTACSEEKKETPAQSEIKKEVVAPVEVKKQEPKLEVKQETIKKEVLPKVEEKIEEKKEIVKEKVEEVKTIKQKVEEKIEASKQDVKKQIDAKKLYVSCAGCHGQNGEKKALGKSQIIKGWDEQKIITALNGYKDGSYGGAMKGVMKGQVASKSQEEIKALAKLISSFK